MMDCLIDNGIDLVLWDVLDLLGASIQKIFELLDNGGLTTRRGNLLGRNGDNADFFISGYGATEDLLNGSFERLRHLTSLLDRHVLHENSFTVTAL